MRIIWAFLPVKRFMADTENICYVDARTGAHRGKMKKTVLFLFILLCFFSCFAQSIKFRNIDWKESKESVMNKIDLTTVVVEEEDYLCQSHGKINSLPCYIKYYFYNNNFTMEEYLFVMNYSSLNSYYEDYESLKQLLTKKYGTPSENIEEWNNEKYKNERDYIGRAISLGHVYFKTAWKDKEGRVVITIQKDEDNGIELSIQYQCLELRESLRQQFENDNMEGL